MKEMEDIKKIIENELDTKNGVVHLISNPNDDCLACMIGDFWFYFVGSEYENLTPNEAYETFTRDELATMIYDAMQDLGDDERHYYESVLMESQEKNNSFVLKESKKEKNGNIEVLKKINKKAIQENGELISFDKQLIQLISGVYDTRYPLIVAKDTQALDYIEDFETNNPLVMNVSTVTKLREKHDIGYEFVSNCEMYLKESVLAFDSYQHDTSKIILLDEVDDDGFPMIAVCRENKQYSRGILINEITSIYDKKNLENMIIKSYQENNTFYKNEKTERYMNSIGFQFPQDVTYALSTHYDKGSFSKSQVEQDLLKDNRQKLHNSIDLTNTEVGAIDQVENLIQDLIEQYNDKINTILNSKNINKIHDGDTLLVDVIEQNVMDRGYDYNGFFEDILNIYQTSADKKAVCELFYEFIGIEFEDFLEQAIEEQKKTLLRYNDDTLEK